MFRVHTNSIHSTYVHTFKDFAVLGGGAFSVLGGGALEQTFLH